jgi:DNA invertase Pin-like site-specific DNA recombinase
MRAAIYARYSTDLQSASSIEDQIRLCRERVEKEMQIGGKNFNNLSVINGD